MSFHKRNFLLVILCFILISLSGRASQKIFKDRIIPVKVVIDQYFIRNFSEIREREPTALPKPYTTMPEDFARSIIKQLSARYRQFGIRFLPVAVERIFVKERVFLDVEYMKILEQSSCRGAELMIGLTGAAFISTSPGDGEFIVAVGSASRETERLFAQFASLGIITNPKLDIENMTDTLDHEIQHLFGTAHKKEGTLNNEEAKIFLQEGILTVRKNRLHKFTCTEPNSSSKK